MQELKEIGNKYKLFTIGKQFNRPLYTAPKWDAPIIKIIECENNTIVIALCFHTSDINMTSDPHPSYARDINEFFVLTECVREIEQYFVNQGYSIKIEYCNV